MTTIIFGLTLCGRVMSKIMLLEATGGNNLVSCDPWREIVEVYMEPFEMVGLLRLCAMKEIESCLERMPLLNTSDMGMQLLRSLKIHLRDTGLKEYPEDPEERRRLIAKHRTV